MAVTALGVTQGTATSATSWALPLPAQVARSTTTIVACASSPSDASTPIPASGWAIDPQGQGSGLGVTACTYTRDAIGALSNLGTNDTPSAALTFNSTNATNTGRNSVAVTIGGGSLAATARIWNGSIASGATANTNGGNAWRMTSATNGCEAGDKIVVIIACNRYNADATLNTGGSVNLSNVQKVGYFPGAVSGAPAYSVWLADCGTTQSLATTPTVNITNPAGAAGSFMVYLHSFKPTVENPTLGGSGNPVRLLAIGDSITQGSAFAGALDGESNGEAAHRWIDRLFGNQSTAIGGNLNFQTNTTVKVGDTTTAWYNGSFTTFDGSRTTSVKVRNMGQAGWDSITHINAAWKPRIVANQRDSGVSPDVLLINLGANDERGITSGAANTAANFRDALVAMATVYTPAPYVVLVKQWAWAFDYVTSSTFARQSGQTHAAFMAAIDDAATIIRASGRACVVVDMAADAEASGGTSASAPTSGLSFAGAVGSSGTVDNVHPNSSASASAWAPAIRTGLDKVPLLGPLVSTGNMFAMF